ncbi:ENTH/VHS/GAT family protein [Euphorbia peplus]|nr:ENTH/VHS/GAT family protein [Euphorbia peplus]
MAAELVNSATNDKLHEVDWTKNIAICELVARDQRQARDVVKSIKKRLGSKHPNAQLYAVMLLEMLMNNIGESVHKEVIDTGVLPILVKIVKKKTELPVRERIFLLLDATQTSLGGASGKFPQYYTAYYELVSAGVKFTQRTNEIQANNPTPQANNLTRQANNLTPQANNLTRQANNLTPQENKKSTLNGELTASRHEELAQQAEHHEVPESSIIQKAGNALEVLKEVLDAVDSQNPEAAKDEFTLDLVEQCSFQKQRVMHLVMTSRDEKLISRAIELNEQLQKILTRHDDLISGKSRLSDMPVVSNRTTSTANHFHREEDEEEEEAEQLFRRLRKGKACARPEDEEGNAEDCFSMGILRASIPGERLNRPLIRPADPDTDHSNGTILNPPPVAIPPPPAKHVEREKFFQEKKVDGSASSGHMKGLSLHSRNASSSCSGSIDFSD